MTTDTQLLQPESILEAELLIASDRRWQYSMPEPKLLRLDDGSHVALVVQCSLENSGKFDKKSRITHTLLMSDDDCGVIKKTFTESSTIRAYAKFLSFVLSHPHVVVHKVKHRDVCAPDDQDTVSVPKAVTRWLGEAYAAGYRVSMGFRGTWFFSTDVDDEELDELPSSGFASETEAWEHAVNHFLQWTTCPRSAQRAICVDTNIAYPFVSASNNFLN